MEGKLATIDNSDEDIRNTSHKHGEKRTRTSPSMASVSWPCGPRRFLRLLLMCTSPGAKVPVGSARNIHGSAVMSVLIQFITFLEANTRTWDDERFARHVNW